MSKKTNQLISRVLPRNAIVTQGSTAMNKVERKFVKKLGCYCMVIQRGREREYIPLGKAMQKDNGSHQKPRCSDCGCDFKNFDHVGCK